MVGKGRHAPAGGAALAQPLRTIDVDVTLRHRRHASRDGAICAVRLQPRHLRKRDNPFAVPMRKPALTLLSGASAAATQPTSGASPPAFGSRGRSAVQGFSCTAGRCARRSLTPRCQTSSSTTSDVDAVEGRAHGHERRLLQLSGANPNATPSPRRARAQDRKVVFSAVVSVVVVCALLERADGSALVGGGVRGPQPTYADPCLPMLTNANH